jgi:predicted secreted hydrolase
MGHAALSDLDRNEHRFAEILYRETPFLGGFGRFPDRFIAYSLGPPGTRDGWELIWNGNGFDFAMVDRSNSIEFRLSTQSMKALVFQGPKGYSPKSIQPGHASLYYSFTRMKTTGEIGLDGKSIPVTGFAWMDKEFSSGALTNDQVGWDWMGLQLDDGRDLMLFKLRNRNRRPDFKWLTQVSSSGEVTYLETDDWNLIPGRTWFSSQSKSEYPVTWDVSLPDQKLLIEAAFNEQENRSRLVPGINYWEGAVRVKNPKEEQVGLGYLEMTGYGESLRPPL